MSFSEFPSPVFADQLAKLPSIQKKFANQTVTQDMLKTSILNVNIYYEDNSYTVIEEQPNMSIVDLVGSLGGTLGELLSFI